MDVSSFQASPMVGPGGIVHVPLGLPLAKDLAAQEFSIGTKLF
jgi:hypothetical protein